MSKTKRPPSNTVASLVGAMQAALAGDIEPPACVNLRPGDRPYWDAVVRARARSEWTDADLVHAGNLARCMADIERIAREVADEGDIITNDKGTPIVNPKHALQETLSRRVMALSRLMQMQAASSGAAEDKLKARKAEGSARAAAKSLEDELIPT